MKNKSKLQYEKPILTRLDAVAAAGERSCAPGSIANNCLTGGVVART
jgi:hypothetical protein